MRGFAYALEQCAALVRQHEPVDARRIITERIHDLKPNLAKCEGGNFYIEQQITAYQYTLDALYFLTQDENGDKTI